MKLLFLSILSFFLLIFGVSKFLTYLDSRLPASIESFEVSPTFNTPSQTAESSMSSNATENEMFYTTEPELGFGHPGVSKLVSLGEFFDPDVDYAIEKTQVYLVNIGPDIDPDSHDVLVTSVRLVNKGEPFDVDAYLDNLEGASVLKEIGDEVDPENL